MNNNAHNIPKGFKPGTDAPTLLLADGHMLDLTHRDASNLVVSFMPPGALGNVTIAALQMRPDKMSFCCLNSDLDDKSRIKFATLLETIAKGLRHTKHGDISMEKIEES